MGEGQDREQFFSVASYSLSNHAVYLTSVVNRLHFEARTRSEPSSNPTFIFEARFRPESQISRVSQDMRNCGILVAYQSKRD